MRSILSAILAGAAACVAAGAAASARTCAGQGSAWCTDAAPVAGAARSATRIPLAFAVKHDIASIEDACAAVSDPVGSAYGQYLSVEDLTALGSAAESESETRAGAEPEQGAHGHDTATHAQAKCWISSPGPGRPTCAALQRRTGCLPT